MQNLIFHTPLNFPMLECNLWSFSRKYPDYLHRAYELSHCFTLWKDFLFTAKNFAPSFTTSHSPFFFSLANFKNQQIDWTYIIWRTFFEAIIRFHIESVAGYGLETTFSVPRDRPQFSKFGPPDLILSSRYHLVLSSSRPFSLFPRYCTPRFSFQLY